MKQIYFWLFAFFTIWQSQAQVASYSFTQSAGTFSPTTGGTMLTSSANVDSYASSLTNIGFDFVFDGVTYTQFSASSNGFVRLGSAASAYTTTPISTASSGPAIAFFTRDAKTSSSGITYLVEGTAPNRVLTIEYLNYYPYYGTVTPAISVQVKLYETTNVIQIVYGASATSTSAYTGQVGIVGTSTSSFNNRTTTTNWSATTAGTSNSATVTLSETVMPSSGLTYTWTPPVPCTGTPTAGTVTPTMQTLCSGTTPAALVVSGYSTGVSGITFQWQESNDNGVADAWENAVGGTGATLASYTPPVFAGTPIYYRAKVICSSSTESDTTSSVLVGTQVAPSTEASALTFTNVANLSFTTGWTNGNGNRRYVVINTSNSFTDPVNGSGDALTANDVYAGTGEQIVYDGTGTSVTVTGLSCNTTYYARVYEYNRCGSAAPYDFYYNTTSSSTNPLSQITTQPATASLPVFNNFSGFTGSNLATVVPGWYEASGATLPNGIASTWANSSVFAGTTSARVNLYFNLKNEWIVSPKFLVNAPSRLKFKAAITDFIASGADAAGMQGTDDKVYVMVATDACGSTWTPIYTFEAANTTTLTNVLTDYLLSLDAYVGQTIQVAFKAVDGPTDDAPDYDFHIANVIIENVPACEAPTAVTSSAITASSATISWTAPSTTPANGYEYFYSTTNTEPTTAGTANTSTSVNLAGLDASTTYYVWVRSACDATTISPWTQSVNFTTLCNSVPVPTVLETFESATSGVPTCWSRSLVSGTYNWNIIANSSGDISSAYQGTNFIEKNYDSSDAVLVSMPIDYSAVATPTRINTYLHRHTYAHANDQYKVYVNTTPSLTGASLLFSLNSKTSIEPVVSATGWYNYTIDIPSSFNGQSSVYVIIEGITTAGYSSYDLGIDNFKVEYTPTDAVDWANLQALVSGVTPAAVTSVQTCQTVRAYSQVYEPSVTEDDVADAGLQVWIGKSTTDTDPATWSPSAWTVATVNSGFDIGGDTNNNDEFYADFSGLTVGTYYIASKYVLNGGPARYGATNNGFWDATHPSAVLTVVAVPSVAASADDASICVGETVTLTATSDNSNFTYSWNNSAGSGASVQVSPTATTIYTVTATDSFTGCTNTANITVVVNPLPQAVVVTPETVSLCANQVQALQATGGNLSSEAVVGTETTLTGTTDQPTAFCNRFPNYWSQTIFTASELSAAGLSAGNINSIAFNITTLGDDATNANFIVKIGTTTESAFANSTYYDASAYQTVYGPATYTHTATGWQVIAFTTPYTWDGTSNIVLNITYDGADDIYNSQTYYTTTTDNKVIWKNSYISSTTSGTTSTKRLNTKFGFDAPGSIVWSPSSNLYADAAATTPYDGSPAATVYAKSNVASVVTYTASSTSTFGCISSDTVEVTYNAAVAAPTGAATHYFCATSDFNTLSYVDVTASGTLIWYDSATAGNVLPSTTVVSNGVMYYAANVVDGCESSRLEITAVDDCNLNVDENYSKVSLYPNPTADYLNISTDAVIKQVEVFNYLGQSVSFKLENDRLDVSNLPIGAYIIKFTFDNGNQSMKQFIKK